MLSAYILRCIAEFDATSPAQPSTTEWVAGRAALQAEGALPPGAEQLAPSALLPYLDDFTGVAGLDQVPHPAGYAPLPFDAEAMRASGLEPAPAGSRLLAHAAIASGELHEAGFETAAPKTQAGVSVISLGLQPDIRAGRILCPEAKRRLLLEQMKVMTRQVRVEARVDRKEVERLTGRLCNLSQLFPEIGAVLSGGYRVACARARGVPRARALLTLIELPTSSRRARPGLLRLSRVATQALTDNEGVVLAAEACFPAPGDDGVLTVVSDASGDVASGDAGFGGFAFHPAFPGTAFIATAPWPGDIAEALAESAREPHLRLGGPRLSMPAAELFATWAVAAAAIGEVQRVAAISAIVSIGDCEPAALALNRASSGVEQMRLLLEAARETCRQWLGVQVGRDHNQDADLLSHPSSAALVFAAARAAGLETVAAAIPAACWERLREIIHQLADAEDD